MKDGKVKVLPLLPHANFSTHHAYHTQGTLPLFFDFSELFLPKISTKFCNLKQHINQDNKLATSAASESRNKLAQARKLARSVATDSLFNRGFQIPRRPPPSQERARDKSETLIKVSYAPFLKQHLLLLLSPPAFCPPAFYSSAKVIKASLPSLLVDVLDVGHRARLGEVMKCYYTE